MLGLRSGGVDLRRVPGATNPEARSSRPMTIESLIESDLAVLDDHALRLTDKGFLICDEITERLLAALSCP